eukprot:CAMPEP_0115702374 /NCGR_PEP_ID=MMETSP0272-20121206/68509_1 /TAXON_ID=71861 /ORGANISM="Scrippsiella trochoidea, Strain CCMP3099" /LENGTH=34 /DNA_ID= /DNA_START= /DNA_END= /DNA_ORIENTATION=
MRARRKSRMANSELDVAGRLPECLARICQPKACE